MLKKMHNVIKWILSVAMQAAFIVAMSYLGGTYALKDLKKDHVILIVPERDAQHLNDEVRKKWPNELRGG